MSMHIGSYLVTEPGMTPLRQLQWLSERELDEAEDRFGPAAFDVRPAADMLGDWVTAAVTGREPPGALTRLVVDDDLIGAGDSDPEPETPDEVEFDAVAMADLRHQAVARYQRWSRLRDLGAPAIVLRNDGRMLQATARAILAAATDDSQTPTVSGGVRSIFSPGSVAKTIAIDDRELRLARHEPAPSADLVQRVHLVPARPTEQRA